MIKACNANKDGKVTKEELLKAVEKHFVGKSYDQAPDWFKHNMDRAFQAHANKNGEISEDEIVKAVTKADPYASVDKIKAAFHHLKGPGNSTWLPIIE
jgi:hypothetical protein